MAQKVTAMDIRAATALAGQVENVAVFCRQQQISRATFYKWRRRFLAEGLAGGGVAEADEAARSGAASAAMTGGDVAEHGLEVAGNGLRTSFSVSQPGQRQPSNPNFVMCRSQSPTLLNVSRCWTRVPKSTSPKQAEPVTASVPCGA